MLLFALQPCIEAAAHSVYYHVNLDTNFEDRTGFICGVAKYNEEATVHAQLVGCFLTNFITYDGDAMHQIIIYT